MTSQIIENNPLAAALNLPARLNLKQSSALLSLSDQERKQVAEWLDLERNAEILQKTDLKIAEKLRAKTAAETIGTSSALKIKNAAQILLESEDDITDDDIDSILGIDSGLSIDDLLNLEDTSLLGLDEDELAFDDYEDDKDYDDDYDEVTYSYEYEDEKDEDYDYEYEEVVTVTKAIPPPRPKPLRPYYQKPKPRPRPQKQYHQAQRYPAPRPSYSYTPAPASYSNYPRPYPRQQSSGAQFLDEVTGLLETAQHQPHITLTGSLRDALLRDVDDHVRTEVNRLPGGRVSTKVSIGPPQQSWQSSFQSNRIQPPSDRFQLASSRSEQPTSAVQPANNQLNLGVNRSQPANSWVRPAAQIDPRIPRRPETRRTSMGTFGDLVSSAEVKEPKERLPIQEISFSEIMGDLLKDKPLPPGLLDNSNQHPGNIRF
ncbi:uncharacterized protein LOC111700311 [Eurytemora carolleeae]|uniref:uncharacterized protein LOC111700311 n=1 Tax=Eurytemora carolleeae TaxID=1294199 RepID=UPI000C76B913|nr:uncharacterized protein LOC111700311 [Eurytemora carolleeae]|eukprot:XP_023326949.1 uncharacterized protein LOC111700311 [Eurytemora affinis]